MKVQIISEESIKPSSETPPHLNNFNLSFLDQLAPPIYVPILLFYASNGENNTESLEKRLRCLKLSLSDVLTSFYLLAGRITETFSIECNDNGVEYLEARVDAILTDVVKNPSVDILKMLLPIDEPYFVESMSPLAIQVNLFNCGGIVISVCMTHQIADASSIATFITCWASKACNSKEVLHPVSELSSPLFPRRDLLGFKGSYWVHRDLVAKRFVFDSSSIASLRANACNSSYVTNPTRVEAVSAFFWRRFMELTKAKDERIKACAALHIVNLRGRIVPPILQVEERKNTLGNIFRIVITKSQEVDNKIELHVLASKLRNALKGIDDEDVKKMQCGDEYLKSLMAELERVDNNEMELLKFTSWCRFPLYEADFGWGNPIWVSTTGLALKNMVILIDNRSDGIEAWVNMLQEDMTELEQDEELLSFVSPTPSA